jgi:hypothetical protein
MTDAYSGTASPLDVLKGIMVLRRVIALNPNLPLSIEGFRAGRQIIFPTEAELRQGHHLVDELLRDLYAYQPGLLFDSINGNGIGVICQHYHRVLLVYLYLPDSLQFR